MKYPEVIRFACLVAISAGLINRLAAQDDCKALLESISESYVGDCKKGLADGQGTAKGRDVYSGEFKKGLPSGSGKYIWANGTTYQGEFKNGLMDGKGTMNIVQSAGSNRERKGYWSRGEYIGEYEHPYQVTSRTAGVLSVRVTPAKSETEEGNILMIQVLHKGRVQQSPNLSISETSGSISLRIPMGLTTKVIVSQFPLGFTLEYMGERIEMMISQAGSWNISIDYNK